MPYPTKNISTRRVTQDEEIGSGQAPGQSGGINLSRMPRMTRRVTQDEEIGSGQAPGQSGGINIQRSNMQRSMPQATRNAAYQRAMGRY